MLGGQDEIAWKATENTDVITGVPATLFPHAKLRITPKHILKPILEIST